MSIRPTPSAATWLLRKLGSNSDNEAVIGDLFEQYQQGRGRVWYWRQVLSIVFLGIHRERRDLVSSGRFPMGQVAAWILIIIALIGVLLSDIWPLAVVAIVGGGFVGILKYSRGDTRNQSPRSDPMSVARIDSSKIPIGGGIAAGIVILILLTGALIELPPLRFLGIPGILAGLLFAAILRLWRRNHIPREPLQSLHIADRVEPPTPQR